MLGMKLSKGDEKQSVEITISNGTVLRVLALTAGVVGLIAAINQAAHALTLIFIAFFLALALNAPVHWLSSRLPGKRKGSRSLATSISFLIIILLLGGFIASVATPLAKQTDKFIDAAPRLVRDFRSQDSETGRFIRKYNLEDQVQNFSDQLQERIKDAGGTAVAGVQRIGNSAFALLTVLVLTFMMLVEGPRWLGFFRSIVPDRRRPQSDRLLKEMYQVIKGYVNGQVLLAAIAAIVITPVIFLLGISYPVALMVIVFICGLIPMVGHTIGAIIVTLVALFQSIPAAIIILAFYILYQQLENIFVQPKIQANSTNMSPLLVFASVLIGISFGGIFAGLVAIPVAGCLRIIVLEYLRSKNIISNAEFKEITTETR